MRTAASRPANNCVNDYILLLDEIRKAVGTKLLSVAVGSDHWNRIDNTELNRLADIVNVMTYDMNNTSHSAMSLTKNAMEGWLTHGISKEKLMLGIPFYSRSENKNYEWTGYNKLIELVENNKAVFISTPEQEYIKIGSDLLSIDTPKSIFEKSEYLKKQGFGGIFCWQELCDFNGTLRNALWECTL